MRREQQSCARRLFGDDWVESRVLEEVGGAMSVLGW